MPIVTFFLLFFKFLTVILCKLILIEHFSNSVLSLSLPSALLKRKLISYKFIWVYSFCTCTVL